MPSVGSTQEGMECMIDLHVADETGATQKYWKLVAPALYWFFYPALMVCWTIMWAWIFSRLGVGIFLVVTGEKNLLSILGFSAASQKRLKRLTAKKKKKNKNGEEEDSSEESS